MLSLETLLEIARDSREDQLGPEERAEFDRFIRRARIRRPNVLTVAGTTKTLAEPRKPDRRTQRRSRIGPMSGSHTKQWAVIVSSVAASIAIVTSVSSYTRTQRFERLAQQASVQRDAALARLSRLELEIGARRVEQSPRPSGAEQQLRLTTSHAGTPVDWETILEHHYDAVLRTPEQNLKKLESVSAAVRAEATRLRRENASISAKEILTSLFQAWGKPGH